MKTRSVVTIGGGSGTFPLLSSLKKHALTIHAIVSTSDSGGSSKRLMDEYNNQLPLGDLRMSLVALAKNQGLWRNLFLHRFEKGDTALQEVGGHSLGNLMLKGLQDMHQGDLIQALHDAQMLLDTAGSVTPATLEHTDVVAYLDDGTSITGESAIDTRGEDLTQSLVAINHIALVPQHAKATPQAIEAIHNADMIIIGPGDLYTSIIPNLLVDGVTDAIHHAHGHIVYICNLMTKHGETDGYTASSFLHSIESYLHHPVHTYILHDAQFPQYMLDMYAKEQAFPISVDIQNISPNTKVLINHLIKTTDAIARHDGDKLVDLLLHL